MCQSVKFGVIIYNRGISRFTPETVAKLCERNPNLVGFKDGVGDIEAMSAMYPDHGRAFGLSGWAAHGRSLCRGLQGAGNTGFYSSAVFNFIPKTAMEFYEAVRSDDHATQHRLLRASSCLT